MGLAKYFAKRRFGKTPEPKGRSKKTKSKKLAFVVQEHHASQLHYDFRLELDSVLKSWAVPKGPSMNPHDRHLAVQVEDHPYEYRKFEGVIPEGNYGAGTVIIWDEGTYEPYHDNPDDEKTLREELKKGHLTFMLHGKKLQGEFALIKMHGQDEKSWLLVKKGDEFASPKDVTKQDESIKSGKKVDEIGSETPALPASYSQYPKHKESWRVKPMLCTLVDEPFNKEGWLFEIKWDGYRAIGASHKGAIELYSRTNNDFGLAYPSIVEALRLLEHDMILDGEIVVTDKDGRPHFELLQNWKRDPQGELRYYVFDILWIDGHDVRDMPLIERKQLLRSVVPHNSLIHYNDHIEARGLVLFKEMKKQGLEGVVAKKADSRYRENSRGDAWLKMKTSLRQEVVIGGFTEPRGGRKYLGSLLVGVYEKGEFVFVGHSGGGIPDAQRKLLQEELVRRERKTSPFAIEPKPNAPVHWVRPEVVCEMAFSEWTNDGSMRHPRFEGLRPDKEPLGVKREESKPLRESAASKEASTAQSEVEFTHRDKIFFPKHKYTKGDVVKYYESMAEYILPYLKDRPLSLFRQPQGINGEGFFQKNVEHLPGWVRSADIFSESNHKDLHWVVGGDAKTLMYILQLGSIEVNPWNSRVQHLDTPDWLVIDLDPEGVTFKDVVKVAQEVKHVCDDWNITCLPKTSGKTGIHIYVPLGANYTYEQAKNLAHIIAIEVNKRQPKLTSIERMPKKRTHKIYLDFLQNRRGQTLAAPYSLRPTPDASVSMPLHWDEVTASLRPTDFTIKNAAARVRRTGDLWKPVLGKGVDIGKILKNIQ
jgi:bifunctional non-homologous end joining protein LigD